MLLQKTRPRTPSPLRRSWQRGCQQLKFRMSQKNAKMRRRSRLVVDMTGPCARRTPQALWGTCVTSIFVFVFVFGGVLRMWACTYTMEIPHPHGACGNTNTNTNTKYSCDTGQTHNKLLEQWVHLFERGGKTDAGRDPFSGRISKHVIVHFTFGAQFNELATAAAAAQQPRRADPVWPRLAHAPPVGFGGHRATSGPAWLNECEAEGV